MVREGIRGPTQRASVRSLAHGRGIVVRSMIRNCILLYFRNRLEPDAVVVTCHSKASVEASSRARSSWEAIDIAESRDSYTEVALVRKRIRATTTTAANAVTVDVVIIAARCLERLPCSLIVVQLVSEVTPRPSTGALVTGVGATEGDKAGTEFGTTVVVLLSLALGSVP
jgi:Na+/serine symporter